jgi:hypothetical protein
MKEEVDLTMSTEHGVRFNICEWDEGGAWIYLQARQASMSTILTRAEAQQLAEALQAILAKEVTA